MSEQAFVSLFTPSRSQPEDLEAILVQRHDILNDAVERVRESATTGNKHHLLFVGPRGTGKTHLVTLLVHRLGQDVALKNSLRIAWLNEDETSTSLLDFLQRIYYALQKRYPGEYDKESLDPMFDLEQTEARQYVIKLLLEKLQQRTLLVVVENLDALFEGLKKTGQQNLRAFIQENPVLSIIATAQKLTDDIKKRKNTFFGFFQTEHLKALSVEEAAELLSKMAVLNKKSDVDIFLKSVTGRSRIRALYHLSGGNHRIYIALSKLITHDNINTLVDLFSTMIDRMTPYYQERIRCLPAQQRKIIEYLCTSESPCAVKKISRYLFATQQSISGQLKDLRDKGYVQSAQRGRESLYEIAEPLMRICVEVKENQSNAPLRILVDFLRIWYDRQELTDRLKGCGSVGLEYPYLKLANEKNLVNGNLRKQLLVKEFYADLDGEQWKRLKYYSDESEALALAYGSWKKGNDEQAISDLNDIVEENSGAVDSVKLSAWALMGEVYYQNKNFKRAVDCLNLVLNLSNLTVFQMTQMLFNRGLAYERLKDLEKAIIDYSSVICMVDAPAVPGNLVGISLYNRGLLYEEKGDYEKAISDFNNYIGLPSISLKQMNQVQLFKAMIYGKQGCIEKEIAEYTSILKKCEKEIDIKEAVLLNRGIAYGLLGDLDKANINFDSLINLVNVSPGKVIEAYISRGSVRAKLGDIGGALIDFNAVIKIKNATTEQVSIAHISQGVIYWRQNKVEKCEQAFKNALLLVADIPVESRLIIYVSLAIIYISDGRWSLAISMLDNGLKESNRHNNQLSDSVAVIEAFFESSLTVKIRLERAGTLARVYQDNSAIAQLGEALIEHLGDVFTSEEALPAIDNLEQWASVWENVFSGIESAKLFMRIFRTGIDFLKSEGKDRGILLNLNKEERQILQQAMSLNDK